MSCLLHYFVLWTQEVCVAIQRPAAVASYCDGWTDRHITATAFVLPAASVIRVAVIRIFTVVHISSEDEHGKA